jgi:hypothetical protein
MCVSYIIMCVSLWLFLCLFAVCVFVVVHFVLFMRGICFSQLLVPLCPPPYFVCSTVVAYIDCSTFRTDVGLHRLSIVQESEVEQSKDESTAEYIR